MREVNVAISSKPEMSYPIIIGENLLQNANEYMKKYCNSGKFLIIKNEKIDKLYGDK